MSAAFDGVQRIVLVGVRWRVARHLMISFRNGYPLHFLSLLLKDNIITKADRTLRPSLQVSLGLTRRGLQHADVPDPVMTCFALKAPAFWQGATQRAAGYLRLAGDNAPDQWKPAFHDLTLDAVLSLHGADECEVAGEFEKIKELLKQAELGFTELPVCRALPRPKGVPVPPDQELRAQWVHFGYRDGLALIGIEGWSSKQTLDACDKVSRHRAGEFVLGHAPDQGSSPWLAGPGLRVWPDRVRAFFHNGSFGVVHLLQQHAERFEAFVADAAAKAGLPVDEIKGMLCGRYPDGRPLVAAVGSDPQADFNYKHDIRGHLCPFGSHVRRMNPRLVELGQAGEAADQSVPDAFRLAHFSLARPLLRRGMPYGRATWEEHDAAESRGLVGHFFCASIEDQFEHLLGEWADRVPIGSPDPGGARDPFIGAHAPGDGPFELAAKDKAGRKRLDMSNPFITTGGVAYLFYPSLQTLAGIARSDLWGLLDKDHRR